ncbi:sensor histidine kinase [Bradyrhizobium embrapense]|uniref:sensor histidine kinase n=1 Tax=Bradyrhizobium embrapense TaxID=630921 RepID=UPI000A027107|nr:sensor histidine kinase [Bradyrhizobium embrapense]
MQWIPSNSLGSYDAARRSSWQSPRPISQKPFKEAILSEDAMSGNLEMGTARQSLALRPNYDEMVLLRETNHRFANTLMVLAFALRREFAGSVSAETRRSFERCEARIAAFGMLHRSLVVGGLQGKISLSDYMEQLCRSLSEALLRPMGVRCELVTEVGDMPAERCERLGLVIAELVTNAARHAFGGRDSGTVRVSILEDGASLVCIVSDDGRGMGIALGGAGSRILDQLVHAMGGEMVVRSGPTGTSVVVTCRCVRD